MALYSPSWLLKKFFQSNSATCPLDYLTAEAIFATIVMEGSKHWQFSPEILCGPTVIIVHRQRSIGHKHKQIGQGIKVCAKHTCISLTRLYRMVPEIRAILALKDHKHVLEEDSQRDVACLQWSSAIKKLTRQEIQKNPQSAESRCLSKCASFLDHENRRAVYFSYVASHQVWVLTYHWVMLGHKPKVRHHFLLAWRSFQLNRLRGFVEAKSLGSFRRHDGRRRTGNWLAYNHWATTLWPLREYFLYDRGVPYYVNIFCILYQHIAASFQPRSVVGPKSNLQIQGHNAIF